jgi:cytochrome P450
MTILNPYASRYLADPPAAFREMHATGPLHATSAGISAVCRHADCQAIILSAAWGGDPRTVDPVRLMFAAEPLERVLSFPELEPPEHTEIRRTIARHFAPALAEAVRDGAERHLAELLEPVDGAGPVDLMADLVVPFVTRTTSDLFGVPASSRESMAEWSRLVSHRSEIRPRRPGEARAEREATAALRQLFAGIVRARREVDAGDLPSRLVRDADVVALLDDEAIAANLAALVVAAQEQPISLVSNSFIALMTGPSVCREQAVDGELDSRAMEELVRFVSPVQVVPRIALAETEIGGVRFRRGEQVLVMVAAANRDPVAFSRPDRLQLGRDPNPHLGFGFGRHRCLGVHLGRIEARLAIAAWWRRFPHAELAAVPGGAVGYEPLLMVRRPTRIVVELGGSRSRPFDEPLPIDLAGRGDRQRGHDVEPIGHQVSREELPDLSPDRIGAVGVGLDEQRDGR